MKKRPATKDGASRKRLSTKWIGRGLLAAAIITGSTAAALALWQKLRPHVSTQPEYLVDVRELDVTPPPKWIRADVKAEVLRDAGLPAQISILDERLKESLTQAFSLHPWVAAVEKVETSYPARISVTVVYRRPVAMVEVHDGLLPVDARGVLLPPEDFTPQEALKYPRVAGLAGSPLGPIGTRWGNPVVEAAAKLAEVLEPAWGELQLHHIASATGAGTNLSAIALEITTRGGTRFVWGRAPGNEQVEEPRANEKLVRLKKLVVQFGLLDKTDAAQRDLSQSVASN
jgi:hypothetical protein